MAAAKKSINIAKSAGWIKNDARKAHRVGKNSKKLVTTTDVHEARNALREYEDALNCDRSIARALYAFKDSRSEFNALCKEHDLSVAEAHKLLRLWVESRDLHLQYREDVKVRAKSK